VPGRERERQLARQRYQRRAARAAAARTRRRRRLTVLGGALGGLVVLAGAAVLVARVTASTRDGAQARTVACTFPTAGRAARDVGRPSGEGVDAGTSYVATIETNRGEITVQLLADQAPCTVHSFRYLARRGFFDDTPCHRLTTGPNPFVLQCGDPIGTGRGGPGYAVADENLRAFGGGAEVTYPAGTLAMANSGRPNTNGSQFFVVYRDSRLDPAYPSFGRVTSGLDVVQQVAAAGASADAQPRQPVRVTDVRVLRRP
jgi:peptidyl-prolyl cis-trans isomerase B (cyclophilin B)